MLDRLEVVRIFDYGLGGVGARSRRGSAGTVGPLMARSDQIPGIRPRATLGRRLDIAARWAFPATCTILLMLLTETPLGIADQAALLPAVTLACVYFWSLFRPAAMPPPVVFVIGLLLDLLGYLPLGVGVLTLLVVHGLALRWRACADPPGVPGGLAGFRRICRRCRGARLGPDGGAVVPPAAGRLRRCSRRC